MTAHTEPFLAFSAARFGASTIRRSTAVSRLRVTCGLPSVGFFCARPPADCAARPPNFILRDRFFFDRRAHLHVVFAEAVAPGVDFPLPRCPPQEAPDPASFRSPAFPLAAGWILKFSPRPFAQ